MENENEYSENKSSRYFRTRFLPLRRSTYSYYFVNINNFNNIPLLEFYRYCCKILNYVTFTQGNIGKNYSPTTFGAYIVHRVY